MLPFGKDAALAMIKSVSPDVIPFLTAMPGLTNVATLAAINQMHIVQYLHKLAEGQPTNENTRISVLQNIQNMQQELTRVTVLLATSAGEA